METNQVDGISVTKCPDYPSGIHQRHCYTMWEAKQNGLGQLIRHLKAYHSPEHKEKFIGQYETMEEFLFSESYVGTPHLICECLERLQFLRFQTVCDMQIEFITPVGSQHN